MIFVFGHLSAVITATVVATYFMIAASAAAIYGTVQQVRIAKKSASAQKKMAASQLAQQDVYAGEYFELSKRQMELQSQQRQIDTLADLITADDQGRQVLTLPVAEVSPLHQLNAAIDRMLKGGR